MSMRTVIDLSPLLETTMPWRTLAALASRSATGVPVLGLCSAFIAARSLRRSLAFCLRRGALAGGDALLDRLLRAGFVRLAGFQDAATLLPRKVVERIRLGRLRLRSGGRLGSGLG